VQKVEEGRLYYETLDGEEGTLDFDFAMLLPPFRGADLQAFDRHGDEITSEVFAPNGFLKGRRQLRREALRAMACRGLASDVYDAQVSEPVRRRHCLCVAAPDLAPPEKSQGDRHLAGTAANGHAFRAHGSPGGTQVSLT